VCAAGCVRKRMMLVSVNWLRKKTGRRWRRLKVSRRLQGVTCYCVSILVADSVLYFTACESQAPGGIRVIIRNRGQAMNVCLHFSFLRSPLYFSASLSTPIACNCSPKRRDGITTQRYVIHQNSEDLNKYQFHNAGWKEAVPTELLRYFLQSLQENDGAMN
jgi:hypothetical protein